MAKAIEFPIDVAPREWSRLFSNVVRSFAKTVTEAVTNSDTSYKRKFNIPDSTGLVGLILAQKRGTKLNTAALKKGLLGGTPSREIQIHLYTARGYSKEPRTCEIVDFAEGLTQEKLQAAFKLYAADKSGVSGGRPGRSLFGRGVSDVLLGHKVGEFFSYKDRILNKALFEFEIAAGKPKCRIEELPDPKKHLASLHLEPDRDGSCVRVLLHDECSIPDEGTIVPLLSQFYMLRLINSDPNVSVRLVRYRAQKQTFDDTLAYDFPIGDIIGDLSFEVTVPSKIAGKSFPALRVEGIVCRAAVATLKGREARETRENGLLIVDDKDAVLDLTFLPEFEGAPYLNKIYGLIRISGVRDVLDHLLNSGKESPLTTTRDGFDTKHEFTQLLFKELKRHLEPIYRKEEDRFKKSEPASLSTEARKRIQEALKHLNKFLTDFLGKEGPGVEPGDKPPDDVPVQFIPNSTQLTVGTPRRIQLVVRTKDVKEDAAVLIDSSNSKIAVSPTSFAIHKRAVAEKFANHAIFLKSDDIHEKATVTSVVDGNSETLEASMTVDDVVGAAIIEPPTEMEFRPNQVKGQPNRRNNLVLFVNSIVIPVGRKIEFRVTKIQGSVGLLRDHNEKVDGLAIKFEKQHLIPGSSAGRILVPWQGDGLGQSARVEAETKRPNGNIVTASATIVVEQPEAQSGLIKRVEYRELENSVCSAFADGVIYINSVHCLNREVFGPTEKEYSRMVESDRTAQYRLSTILLEQSVYQLAEKWVLENKLVIQPYAPITSIREFIDAKTNAFAPKLLRVLIGKPS
jgi:hypothetical protein